MRITLTRIIALLTGAALLMAGCTNEPEKSAAKKTPGEDAKLAKACEGNVEINKGFNKVFADIPQSEGPPTPEVTKKITDGINQFVLPHVEAVENNAPEEIADEIAIGAKSVRRLRDDPASDPFEEEEVDEAVNEIDEYFFENCDHEKLTVAAKEYEFSKVPDEIETGDVSVKLENEGREVHEFVVLTRKEGVTESFDDILALDEAQAQEKVDFVSGADAGPGEEGYGIFSFEKPGDYVAVCFVSKGTTGEEEAEESPSPGASPSPAGSQEEGQPHFTLGMKKEFKVV
ncbi:MAG: hypothetical protein ACRDIU_05965 [Actinomycetota bacterium]